MTLTENIRIFWDEMTGIQKTVVIAVVVLIAGLLISGWVGSLVANNQIRKFEREANTAKREAEDALKKAATIAREKLEFERRLAEAEARRDGKQTELETAHIQTLDARAEYDRALREQRGDDPTAEQLCAELAALGYPCR